MTLMLSSRASFYSLSKTDFKCLCFLLALGIYGVLGSPTPDNVGIVEITIGFLLLASLGVKTLANTGFNLKKQGFWQKSAYILLVFSIFCPVFVGLMHQNSIFLMIRDIFSFIFLIIPLFFASIMQRNRQFPGIILGGTLFIGFCFALRALLPLVQLKLPDFLNAGDLAYFANAPTVLFTGLFLLGLSGCYASGIKTARNVLLGISLFLMALLPLASMAFSLQRATMGAVLIYVGMLVVMGIKRSPAKTVFPLLLCGTVLWLLYPLVTGLGNALVEKTLLVGLNMRLQEVKSVWQIVSSDPFQLLFGIGWGGSFNSPAVGELNVNFTHSLLTSMLLKTGLCGLVLTVIYLSALGKELLKLILNVPVMGLAIAAPILINVFLYASYKSLDFGLVLLMIPAMLQLVEQRREGKQVE